MRRPNRENRKTTGGFVLSRSQKRYFLPTAVLLLLIGLVWVDRNPGVILKENVRRNFAAGTDFEKYHGRDFSVVKVTDGDTIDIYCPDGKYLHTRLRLLGVDTPETKNPRVGPMYFGEEAAAFTESLVTGGKIIVRIDTISPSRDRYGRLLAFAELPDGTCLSEELVRTGHAYADLRFNTGKFDKLVRLQQKAIESKAGLWKNVTRSQLPGWLKRERPLLLSNK